jgi:hypothetical protein
MGSTPALVHIGKSREPVLAIHEVPALRLIAALAISLELEKPNMPSSMR